MVLFTAVKNIAVKVQSITWIKLYLNQWKYLQQQGKRSAVIHLLVCSFITLFKCSTRSTSAPVCCPTRLCSILPALCDPRRTYIRLNQLLTSTCANVPLDIHFQHLLYQQLQILLSDQVADSHYYTSIYTIINQCPSV